MTKQELKQLNIARDSWQRGDIKVNNTIYYI